MSTQAPHALHFLLNVVTATLRELALSHQLHLLMHYQKVARLLDSQGQLHQLWLSLVQLEA